jgi:hypothetical protein
MKSSFTRWQFRKIAEFQSCTCSIGKRTESTREEKRKILLVQFFNWIECPGIGQTLLECSSSIIFLRGERRIAGTLRRMSRRPPSTDIAANSTQPGFNMVCCIEAVKMSPRFQHRLLDHIFNGIRGHPP